MSVNETIQDIRARLKAVKGEVAAIEFRLSELEYVGQAPQASSDPAVTKRPPGAAPEAAVQAEDEAEQPVRLQDEFPILPHESAGVDCGGRLIMEDQELAGGEKRAILKCNECGLIVGWIHAGILADLVYLINAARKRR